MKNTVAATGSSASGPTSSKPRLRVAVVDDDRHFLEATCFLLKMSGLTAEAFLTVEEFTKAGAAERLDCLVLDVELPDIDGPSLYQSIRASGLTLPVIFCSGMGPEELAERGFCTQGVTVLRKPVRGRELEDAIRAACAKATG